MLEYKDADRVTKTNPKIKFEIISTGYTLETSLDRDGVANINVGARQFKVGMIKPSQDDSPIRIDFGEFGRQKTKSLHYSDLDGYVCSKLYPLSVEEDAIMIEDKKVRLTEVTEDWKVRLEIEGERSPLVAMGMVKMVDDFRIHPILVDRDNNQATLCMKW